MKRSPELAMFAIVCIIALLILLCSCTSTARHVSDPRVSGDGYNYVCLGVELGKRVTIEGNVCHNTTGYRGEVIDLAIRYHWRL